MLGTARLVELVALAATGVAAAQYLQLYVLRRWERTVELPDPAFYALERSRTQGQPFRLGVHGTGPIRLTLQRMGAVLEPPNWTRDLDATRQSPRYTPWTGMNWPVAVEIPTNGLEPGMYLARAANLHGSGRAWRTTLILRPSTPQPLRVICSTNTWDAYNAFGGVGNYEDTATPWPLRALVRLARDGNLRWVVGERHAMPIVPLPELRPNAALNDDLVQVEAHAPIASHLAAGEWNLLRLLEREHIPYELCGDRDFAHEGAGSARAVVFNTHSEYWSPDMEGRLTRLIADGARVAFFSGNNLYRGVRLAAGAVHVTEQRFDPRQVAALIGSAYDAYGYTTQAPFRVERRDHWVFDGVDPDRPLGTWTDPQGQAWGASGWETDKIRAESAAFEVLAVGTNEEGPAYMTYRATERGGWIFNAGSVTFTRLLGLDPALDRVALNVVRRALA